MKSTAWPEPSQLLASIKYPLNKYDFSYSSWHYSPSSLKYALKKKRKKNSLSLYSFKRMVQKSIESKKNGRRKVLKNVYE